MRASEVAGVVGVTVWEGASVVRACCDIGVMVGTGVDSGAGIDVTVGVGPGVGIGIGVAVGVSTGTAEGMAPPAVAAGDWMRAVVAVGVGLAASGAAPHAVCDTTTPRVTTTPTEMRPRCPFTYCRPASCQDSDTASPVVQGAGKTHHKPLALQVVT